MCHTRSRRRFRLGVSLWVLDFVPELKSCHRSAIVCHQTRDQAVCHMHSVQCSSPRCTLYASSWAHCSSFCSVFFFFLPQALFKGFYSCWSMLGFLFLMISCRCLYVQNMLICITEITSCKFVTCDISPNKWKRLYCCFSFLCTCQYWFMLLNCFCVKVIIVMNY